MQVSRLGLAPPKINAGDGFFSDETYGRVCGHLRRKLFVVGAEIEGAVTIGTRWKDFGLV